MEFSKNTSDLDQSSLQGITGHKSFLNGAGKDAKLGFTSDLSFDQLSLETIIEAKISRFLEQLGEFPPDNLYDIIMGKVEKPLIQQVLRRSGGNQVQAAKTLGINRNTLRKKIRIYTL